MPLVSERVADIFLTKGTVERNVPVLVVLSFPLLLNGLPGRLVGLNRPMLGMTKYAMPHLHGQRLLTIGRIPNKRSALIAQGFPGFLLVTVIGRKNPMFGRNVLRIRGAWNRGSRADNRRLTMVIPLPDPKGFFSVLDDLGQQPADAQLQSIGIVLLLLLRTHEQHRSNPLVRP